MGTLLSRPTEPIPLSLASQPTGLGPQAAFSVTSSGQQPGPTDGTCSAEGPHLIGGRKPVDGITHDNAGRAGAAKKRASKRGSRRARPESMDAELELPVAQRPRLHGDTSNTRNSLNTRNVKREVSRSGAPQVPSTRANVVASSSARQLSPPQDIQHESTSTPGRILRPRPPPSIAGSQVSSSPAPQSRRGRKGGRNAIGGARNNSTSTPPPRPKRGRPPKSSSTTTAESPQPQHRAHTAAPTNARQPLVLHAGQVEPANYKIDLDDDGRWCHVRLDPGDFIYEYRPDGDKPNPSFNFPVVYSGQDSESEPELDNITYVKPEKMTDAEEDDEPVFCSHSSWARRGCMTDPPFHEEALNYAQVDGPAYYGPGARGGLPRPDGAVLTRFMRVPGDLQHPNMSALVRYPNFVKSTGPKSVIPLKGMAAKLGRIVVQTDHGGLVVKNDGGRRVPCMVPMDHTDLWYHYTVADAQSDITPDIMCLADGLCKSTPSRQWNPSIWCQIRWCRRCENFMHVLCMRRQQIHDLAFYADYLDEWDQSYLRYLLQEHDFAPDEPPRMPFGFDHDPDLGEDVHDEAEAYPMPQTTWAEVAALPIRRRTFPTEAPETNEVVIQHAVRQVLDGRGGDVVPDVREWLHGIAPQAGLRAAKTILNKNLRQSRHGKGARWFLCPACEAQII
ncbi:hypothetical protein BD626DRAFT_441790 [Schizophyllum amplum]|uniref:Uncharacterized protein n=1 Tax=Schizophyllum amplum TaxID=97359 RepID=A0A550BTI9_9AGAR|nr:hypothetical protein BD626DRAFT_441790 [Auriculariopsis ampla]